MSTPVLSASTRIARDRIVRQLSNAEALSVDRAVALRSSNGAEKTSLNDLIDFGAVQSASDGRLYLNTERFDIYKSDRTTRILKILGPVLVGVAVMILTGRN